LALFVTNFSEEANALYRQDLAYTDVSFPSNVGPVSIPFVGWGTAFTDYDNDGWLDLLVANGHVYPQVDTAELGTTYKQRLLLFRNQGTLR
jgi:hypothetical protein